MPVTPRAARRRSNTPHNADSSHESASKLKPQRLSDSTTVQDRIRQWQAQGAATALDPDAVSVRSTPLSDYAHDRSRASVTRRSRTQLSPPTGEVDGRTETRKTEMKRGDDSTSSAPRKRLVSDEYWKARRQEKDKESPEGYTERDHSYPISRLVLYLNPEEGRTRSTQRTTTTGSSFKRE